jgi:hypothetical protein
METEKGEKEGKDRERGKGGRETEKDGGRVGREAGNKHINKGYLRYINKGNKVTFHGMAVSAP